MSDGGGSGDSGYYGGIKRSDGVFENMITSSRYPTVSTSATWLSATIESSGSTARKITYTTDPNDSTSARTGYIYLKYNGSNATGLITVNQDGKQSVTYHWYDWSSKEVTLISTDLVVGDKIYKINDQLYSIGTIKCAPSINEDSPNPSQISIENFTCTNLPGITKNTVVLETSDRPGWLLFRLFIKESSYLDVLNDINTYTDQYPINISFKLVYQNATLTYSHTLKLLNKTINMKVSTHLKVTYNLPGSSTEYHIEINGAEQEYTAYELPPGFNLTAIHQITNVKIKKLVPYTNNDIHIFKGTSSFLLSDEIGVLRSGLNEVNIGTVTLNQKENIYCTISV